MIWCLNLSKHFPCSGLLVQSLISGGAELNGDIPLLNLICQGKTPGADGSGPLARAALSTLFKKNGRLVVLVQDVLFDIVPLRFHEKLGPQDHLHHVIGTHQLSISAAPGIQLLFPLSVDQRAHTHRHPTTSGALEIWINGESNTNMSLDD